MDVLKLNKMSRLTKFIESKMGKGDAIIKSNSSDSIYFTIKSKKVRVSNHFNNTFDASDLNIVIPANSKTLYMLLLRGSTNPLIMTYSELKSTLEVMFLTWSVGYKNAKITSDSIIQKYENLLKVNSELSKDVEKLNKQLNRYVNSNKESNKLTSYEKQILDRVKHVKEQHRLGLMNHFDNLLKNTKK